MPDTPNAKVLALTGRSISKDETSLLAQLQNMTDVDDEVAREMNLIFLYVQTITLPSEMAFSLFGHVEQFEHPRQTCADMLGIMAGYSVESLKNPETRERMSRHIDTQLNMRNRIAGAIRERANNPTIFERVGICLLRLSSLDGYRALRSAQFRTLKQVLNFNLLRAQEGSPYRKLFPLQSKRDAADVDNTLARDLFKF